MGGECTCGAIAVALPGPTRGTAWPLGGTPYSVPNSLMKKIGRLVAFLGRPHRGVVLPVGRVRLIGAQVAVTSCPA